MKTTILALFLCISANINNNGAKVYICTRSGAYAYHVKKTCWTLKRCNEEGHIKTVSLNKAREMGRTPCKVCTR